MNFIKSHMNNEDMVNTYEHIYGVGANLLHYLHFGKLKHPLKS